MKIKENRCLGTTIESKRLDDFCITLTSYPPESIIPKHLHKNAYLCLLVNGIFEENTGKNIDVIKTGFSFFRGTEHNHSNQFSKQQGLCFNLEFNNLEKFIVENEFSLPGDEIMRPGTVEIYRLLYSFKQNLAEDLLNILCYESFAKHFDMLPVSGRPDWIRKIKELFHDDPFSSISLTHLSKEFNLHPNYIVRKFKAVTGYRLSEYLNRIRIESALSKMVQSEKSLTEIACHSGFYDQSHFIHNFKNYFSVSPKRYRKIMTG